MISVVIPTYNRAKTIVRSAKSVLEQTYKDLELIIVDDGSTDNTKEVIAELTDPRVSYYKLEKNGGQGAARNFGVEKAKGEYIAFQDSDDVWLPEKLEKQMAIFSSNPDVDVCFCRKKRIDLEGNIINLTHENVPEGILPYKSIVSYPKVSTQTVLAKREVMEEFKFDASLKCAEDYEWSICAVDKYVFYYLKEALVDQYFQGNSVTLLTENTITNIDALKAILEKHRPDFEKHPDLEYCLTKSIYRKSLINKLQNNERPYKELWNLYKLTHGKRFLYDMFLYFIGRKDKMKLG